MVKNEIGVSIRKGMPTKEIKKKFNIQEELNVKYLENVGYSNNTSKVYINMLKKNDQNDQNVREEKSTEKNSNDHEKKEDLFIKSKNADENNVIIDTCALQNQKTIDIIEKSQKVTVLLAVIKEMDSLKYSFKKKGRKVKSNEMFMLSNISKYAKKFLTESKKYQLVPFDVKGENYTDNKIIQYIKTLPVDERPTLLTSDVLLTVTAKCIGLEYILYAPANETKIDNSQEENEDINLEDDEDIQNTLKVEEDVISEQQSEESKTEEVRGNLGVNIKYCDGVISIKKYNRSAIVMCVKADKSYELKGYQIDAGDIDYFVILAKFKKMHGVKMQKIIINNQENIKEEYHCVSVNELKKLENKIDSGVIDKIKEIL